MTPGECSEEDYLDLQSTFEQAMGEWFSAFDELENSVSECSEENIDNAVSVVDSTLTALDDALVAYLGVVPGATAEDVGIRYTSVDRARPFVDEALEAVGKIMTETPSDGELLEEMLEEMQTVVEELVESLRRVFGW